MQISAGVLYGILGSLTAIILFILNELWTRHQLKKGIERLNRDLEKIENEPFGDEFEDALKRSSKKGGTHYE